MTTFHTTVESPVGPLLLTSEDGALTRLHFTSGPKAATAPDPGWRHDRVALTEPIEQLRQYFAGERRTFDVALAPYGTDFELRVWGALREIPYGETMSYGELARHIGSPTGARAVGLANGRNPIAVIVPCHRVIGADGSLTGFGGGLPTKRYLLDMEAGRMPLSAALA